MVCLPAESTGKVGEKVEIYETVDIIIDGEEIKPEVKSGKLIEIINSKDYGKTINYKTIVQGEEINNWKVFYNNGSNVYIILEDYLPNKLVPASTGLKKQYTYSIYSNTSRNELIKGLTTTSYWSEFARGVDGATAVGAPSGEMFISSYNAKSGGNLNYTTAPFLGTIDSLFVPNLSILDNCLRILADITSY